MRTLLPALGVAIATLSAPCLACTIVTPSISVGPDFRLKLESRYDNLKGGQRLSITSHRGGRTLLVEPTGVGLLMSEDCDRERILFTSNWIGEQAPILK